MTYNSIIKVAKKLNHSTVRYAFVGAIAFGADYFILVLFYYFLHFPLTFSVTVGFLIGFIISFTSNKKWVFKGGQRKKTIRQILEYFSLVVFNYFFTIIIVDLLNNLHVSPAVSKLLAMGVIMCWNYALFRWVIFVPQTSKHTNP